MLTMIADVAAATGISTANATIVVNAINAGMTVFAIVGAFSSFGLTTGILIAARKMATKKAIAY
ncbi:MULTISPECIES: hypothetical protein [Bacillus]|uniref:Uncharacterized protein n=2 Tax=Bacillus cereus TaxID=1396 RepID=A0A9W5R1F1_BACCE|nr:MULTISPECIES: hypothetical protein [Bacillus cereus group]EOQ02909.1 hypothetical protein IKC_05831 [Bacillus cereus VD184]MCU5026621.1 hypothetical protein [Bacillus cereus]MDN4871834.1 hypothetical protein [Bacillus cereus]MEB9551836.1 hypothetical protein [Bacillus cereus]MEB9571052.1 hypothetical protein [Bacillus cereus]